jgi:hypothetical protein
MTLDASGRLLVGLTSALANGKLQVAGSIGLSGNTEIRQATDNDGSTLRLLATQVVAGVSNSYSYGYTGGGLLASISNAASTITLDTGGATAGHRLQVQNDGTGSSGVLNYSEAGTSRFYVNSSTGNVGIGTSSPSNKLVVSNGGAAGAEIRVVHGDGSTAGGSLLSYNRSGSAFVPLEISGSYLKFSISDVEKARLDASGNLLVGTTTALDPLTVTNGITINGGGLDFATSGVKNWQVVGNATDFYIGNQTLTRYAALAGITTFTAWTFVSDERLKENIEPLNYGINEVMQLRPTRYKFKNEEQTNIGFIAQEVKQIIPEMVAGSGGDFDEKDTAEQRANKTLGISKETLIPILVKAIQEQQALIQSLTDRIAQLEAK